MATSDLRKNLRSTNPHKPTKPNGIKTPHTPHQAARRRRGHVEDHLRAQETKTEAEKQWDIGADILREKQPKLGALMDNSRDDVLAYMDFPKEHWWAQVASTNPPGAPQQGSQTPIRRPQHLPQRRRRHPPCR
jgi:hypothetical protein